MFFWTECIAVSPQYIFGEFSPDEINQFFVTPRCYVEVRKHFPACRRLHLAVFICLCLLLRIITPYNPPQLPPFNDKAPCITQSSGTCTTSQFIIPTFTVQSCGIVIFTLPSLESTLLMFLSSSHCSFHSGTLKSETHLPLLEDTHIFLLDLLHLVSIF